MKKQRISKVEKKLKTLWSELGELGDMRPGTLSVQYRKPEEQKHPFHQLSYTFQGKSRSEYIRTENLPAIRREIKAYKKFKALSEEIVELSIEASRTRCMKQK